MLLKYFFNRLAAKSDDMTFWEHAEILRVHLIRILLVLTACSTAAFFFKDFLFGTVICGPLSAGFATYGNICKAGQWLGLDTFCFDGLALNLINIDLAGQFRWHMIISFAAGLLLTVPFAVWQLWIFIKPALQGVEKKYGQWMWFVSSLLFFIGLLFGYFVLLPLTILFLGRYTLSPDIINQITIASYISTAVALPLMTGLVFELPVLVYFLSKTGLLKAATLRKQRKTAIIILLVVAAIITPSTDIFSMLLVALPLFGLYEISVGVARRAEK